ncbi:MAG TPA: hypothetical protein VIY49_31225 [Bryobacteraceae bacterium]
MPLLILLSLTLAAVSTVGWFGWRLLKQEGVVQTERAQERLEQAADRVVALVHTRLAETAENLTAAQAPTFQGDLVLSVKDGGMVVVSGGPLLYQPIPSQEPEADPNLFAEAELVEFSSGEPSRALEEYRRLATSPNPAIRAGALVREARVLRNTGRERESRALYSVLAGMRGVAIGGAPADLAARCALGDPSIKEDLLKGRWALTRGQFEFYWSQAADGAPPPETAALAEAAALAGQSAEGFGSGQRTAWIRGEPFFLLWRNGTVLVTRPGRFIEGVGEGVAPEASLRVAAADADGHIVYGQRSSPGNSSARGGGSGGGRDAASLDAVLELAAADGERTARSWRCARLSPKCESCGGPAIPAVRDFRHGRVHAAGRLFYREGNAARGGNGADAIGFRLRGFARVSVATYVPAAIIGDAS